MKNRIQQIMNNEQMTQQSFAATLGISPASLSSIFTGRTNPTQNHVQAIHRTFPKINIKWLMFGEGDMYEEQEGANNDACSSGDENDGNVGRGENEKNEQTDRVNKNKGTDSPTPQSSAKQQVEIRYLERPPRKITEIRIFFDDGTYETFSRN